MRADRDKKAKAGGSTLKRLKKNLKDSGLLVAPTKSHKAQRPLRKRPEKPTERRVNPFEVKVNRQKHEVLGRKIKGAMGNPVVARQLGNENVFF
jgi:nucleolar protein 14